MIEEQLVYRIDAEIARFLQGTSNATRAMDELKASVDKSQQSVDRLGSKAAKELGGVAKAAQTATASINQTKSATQGLGDAFSLVTVKVAAFLGVIALTERALRQLKNVSETIDAALARSSMSFWERVHAVTGVGQLTPRTIQALEAAQQSLQGGRSFGTGFGALSGGGFSATLTFANQATTSAYLAQAEAARLRALNDPTLLGSSLFGGGMTVSPMSLLPADPMGGSRRTMSGAEATADAIRGAQFFGIQTSNTLAGGLGGIASGISNFLPQTSVAEGAVASTGGDLFGSLFSGGQAAMAPLEARQQQIEALSKSLSDNTQLAGAAFGALSSGVAAAVDAAISGSASIGQAMARAAAAALRATAVESTVKAAYHGAMALGSLAFGDAKGAAFHGAAALKFAATAALAGVGSAGLGALAGGGGASAGAVGGSIGPSAGGGISFGGDAGRANATLGGNVTVVIQGAQFLSSAQLQVAVAEGVEQAQRRRLVREQSALSKAE